MNIRKFISSNKIENDYNKIIHNELDAIKYKTENNQKYLYKVSECDFLEPTILPKKMIYDPNICDFEKNINPTYLQYLVYGGPMIKRYLDPSTYREKKDINNVCVPEVFLSNENLTKANNNLENILDNICDTVLDKPNNFVENNIIYSDTDSEETNSSNDHVKLISEQTLCDEIDKSNSQNSSCDLEENNNLILTDKYVTKNYYIVYVTDTKTKIKDIFKNTDIHGQNDFKGHLVINTSNSIFYIDIKSYSNISHIIFSENNPLNRILLNREDLWVSGMFILEFYKRISCYNPKSLDPYFGYPEDVLEIYDKQNKQKTVKSMIDMICVDSLRTVSKDILETTIIIVDEQKYTALEYAIIKIMELTHPVIIYQMQNIIMFLSGFQYFRPVFFIARKTGFDSKFPNIYDMLNSNQHYLAINTTVNIELLETMYHVDMFIINNIIKQDENDNFIKYISHMNIVNKFKEASNSKTVDKIIHWIIENKAIGIMKSMITNNMLSDYRRYQIIFLTEEFDLLGQDFIDLHVMKKNKRNIKPKKQKDETKETCFLDKTNQRIILEILNDVIIRGISKSFYIILKICPFIINDDYKFKINGVSGTLLHAIKSDISIEILDIIIKKNEKLMNISDANGIVPLIKYANIGNDMANSIKLLIEYGADYEMTDNVSNTFLHALCPNNVNNNIIQQVIRKTLNILNAHNDKMLTPIMIAAINKNEEIFYTLKGVNAYMDFCDVYGNTVYHYVCKAGICPGIMIPNKKNKFGFTPYDYCSIDPKFYYFQES